MGAVVQVASADVAMALAAEICLGCGSAKRPAAAVCESCFLALPLYLRDWITRPNLRLDTFQRALQHLVDIRLLRNRRWSYRSLEELELAGCRISGRGQCESLRCLREVLWLWTPQHRRMPVDPITCEPHAVVCLDPVGVALRRIRRLQTPARRRGRAKRRA